MVRKGREAWRVPAQPETPRPVLAVSFRKDQNYAVWDDRGLTVRRGTRTFSTYLPEIPTSPRAFPRAEILKTIDLLQQAKRTRNAAALSGAMRIGNDAYFLLRWEDTSGKPWAEALVKVDLSADDLKPKFLGRFEGLSVAYRPIDDRLVHLNGIPATVTRTADAWGMATYDPKTQKFGFRPMGAKLISLLPLGRSEALFVETTAYGTTAGGEVDLETGRRQERFESRGNARFVDAVQPWFMVATRGTSTQIRNGETGSEAPIPTGAGIVRAGAYVVVFTPYANPTSATLYEPERWKKLATWKAP
ncbi:MAG: hypothetical protein ACO1SV_20195 [Fimbriimonas sp.]